jgi:hypothetical protein
MRVDVDPMVGEVVRVFVIEPIEDPVPLKSSATLNPAQP